MRLLNTTTFQLVLFSDDHVPPYAILSHTWADEEVSFESLSGAATPPTHLRGWAKIAETCAASRALDLAHVWVDTCCIGKSSSAELSEAINSMFRWYQEASVCIAYLADVGPVGDGFEASRWFTRGWTLQELIAPRKVLFYGGDWAQLGTRFRSRASSRRSLAFPSSSSRPETSTTSASTPSRSRRG